MVTCSIFMPLFILMEFYGREIDNQNLKQTFFLNGTLEQFLIEIDVSKKDI